MLEDKPSTQREAFYLLPEQLPTLQLWCGVQTQWHAGPTGALGLDYARIRAHAGFARIRVTPQMWADLQAMERAVLDEWRLQRLRNRSPS